MNGFVVCVVVWIGVFLLLKFLESSQYRNQLYNLLNQLNLEISIGYVKWYTSKFNRAIVNLVRGSEFKRKAFSLWFFVGTCVSLLLGASSLLLLLYNMYSIIYAHPNEQPVMTPLVPGVNIPVSQIPYLFISLLVSAVLHELGHAMAAANLRKEFSNIGMFLFFIFPGAFVTFLDEFEDLLPLNKLKIYCAGAWHNVVIVIIATLLTMSMSVWMSPLYQYNQGTMILAVDENSPMNNHLLPGDLIVGLNDCSISNSADWIECLMEFIDPATTPPGYCVPDLALSIAETSSDLECCESGYMGALQCFSPSLLLEEELTEEDAFCMSARQVLSQTVCYSSEECSGEKQQCLFPVSVNEGETLMKIEKDDGSFVIFVGHPSLLYSYARVVDYVPKFEFLKRINLHFHAENMLYYLISISSALGILNMAPVFLLDGQWAFIALCDILLPHYSSNFRKKVANSVLWVVSCLFVLNIALSTLKIFLN